MREVVIVSAVRTAIGSFNGALADVAATDLGALVVKDALERAGVSPDQVDEVFLGNVLQAGLGQNPARQAAIKAGLPQEIPSLSVNKVCGSGLRCVTLAAQSIMSGDNEIVVAGGMENMSQSPYLLDKARFGYRMGDGKIVDSMIKDGLWCAFSDYHMGITAENVAEKFNVTRQEQDDFSFKSQQKAVSAIEKGLFKEEIVPVVIPSRKGDITFDTDEFPPKEVTAEGLAKLKPAFKKEGTVTAGNASGINDGAAALVIMSADKAKELGIKPMAKIIGFASAGVDPSIMGIGPVPASQKALKKAGMTIDQMDLIEANEAFAAQALAVGKELGFDSSKLNITGGAIALGHPIGASGARVLVTLLHGLKRENKKYGLVTLCIGGGQGVAAVVESIE